MTVTCPHCGAPFDVTSFAFERRVRCLCGTEVDAGRARAPRARKCPASVELRRRGDALTWTILYSDLPRVDVDIAIAGLREWVHLHLPDRVDLFEMVWVARWERLRDQGWEHRRPDR